MWHVCRHFAFAAGAVYDPQGLGVHVRLLSFPVGRKARRRTFPPELPCVEHYKSHYIMCVCVCDLGVVYHLQGGYSWDITGTVLCSVWYVW